jgi:hypothetical protein
MALTQHGMAEFLHEQLRPAHPAGEEHEQLVLGILQVRRMHLADAVRFRQLVHQLIEALHQFAHLRFAADALVMRARVIADLHRLAP